jgi:hypothetical protein
MRFKCLAGPLVATLLSTTPDAAGDIELCRIDLANPDDRVYLQGQFYPPLPAVGPPAETLEEYRHWGEGDWFVAFPGFLGGRIEVPVIPGYDHRLEIRLAPLEECDLKIWTAPPAMRWEHFHEVNEDYSNIQDTEPLIDLRIDDTEPCIVEVPLSAELIDGREHIGLFCRSVAVDGPDRHVGTRMWWVRILVDGAAEEVVELRLNHEETLMMRERFTLTVPSVAQVGEPFDMTIVARTRAGYPDASSRDTLRLISNTQAIDNLPERVTFTEEDAGVIGLDDLICTEEGNIFIRAFEAERAERTWRSNTVLCAEEEPEFQLYWGDLHVHTTLSDGYRRPEFALEFARDVSALDFISLNDHDQWLSESKWAWQQGLADEHSDPGEFVAICGTEWTNLRRGHHSVWFPGDDSSVLAGITSGEAEFFRPITDTPVAEMAECVGEFEGILSSHHLHWVANFDDWDVRNEPVIEIYSHWGSSERPATALQTSIIHGSSLTQRPDYTAVDLLNRGIRVGFIGGSDSHVTAPGANVAHNHWAGVAAHRRPGLAAVYARELTREGILEAIRARRCYATMNERIIIRFSINGHFMGEEFTLEEGPANIEFEVFGTDQISSIQVIRDGEEIYAPLLWGTTDHIDLNICDYDVPPGDHHYYLRVEQIMHGEYVTAWSSPIWVTVEE